LPESVTESVDPTASQKISLITAPTCNFAAVRSRILLIHGKKWFCHGKKKIGTNNKIPVAVTKNFAAATKRFVGRTKHFVVVTKCFYYSYLNK